MRVSHNIRTNITSFISSPENREVLANFLKTVVRLSYDIRTSVMKNSLIRVRSTLGVLVSFLRLTDLKRACNENMWLLLYDCQCSNVSFQVPVWKLYTNGN